MKQVMLSLRWKVIWAALALEPENVELLGRLADLASVIGMSDLAVGFIGSASKSISETRQ